MLAHSWYKFDRSRKFIPIYKVGGGHWPRLRRGGISCLGARNLSRCRILIEGRCACPGITAIIKFVMGAGANAKSVTTCPASGGKQLTHIVRVELNPCGIALTKNVSNKIR